MASWVSQGELAEVFGIGVRQIRELEGRGLPSKGALKKKEYPFPHCICWYSEYRRFSAQGEVVDQLPIGVAMALHKSHAEMDEAEHDGKLRLRRRR